VSLILSLILSRLNQVSIYPVGFIGMGAIPAASTTAAALDLP
jgi:hypothetical protein